MIGINGWFLVIGNAHFGILGYPHDKVWKLHWFQPPFVWGPRLTSGS